MKTWISAVIVTVLALFLTAPFALQAQEVPQTVTVAPGEPEVVVSAPADEQQVPIVVQDAAQVTSDTTVVLPAGDWVSDIIENAGGIVGAIVTALFAWALRFLPKAVSDFLKTMRVEQILARAVDYALNAVAGAARDKVLTIDVGSKVVAEALQYVINLAPARLVDWMGGPDAIRKMILARITLESTADAQRVLGSAPTVVVKG